MAEILIPGQGHQQRLFREQEPVVSDAAFSPLRRGPMYSAYAELREWKLRQKKDEMSSSCPIPVQMRSFDESAPSDFRKENRKPHTPAAQRFNPSKAQMLDSSRTPPPAMRPEMRRAGSMSAGKREEKRGGPVLGGGDRADEFLLMRSFSSYQELACRNEEEGRRGRAASSGILRKTFSGFRRSTAKATSWIG